MGKQDSKHPEVAMILAIFIIVLLLITPAMAVLFFGITRIPEDPR